MGYFKLGFMLIALVISSISHDKTVLTKVIAEISEHSEISKNKSAEIRKKQR